MIFCGCRFFQFIKPVGRPEPGRNVSTRSALENKNAHVINRHTIRNKTNKKKQPPKISRKRKTNKRTEY